MTEPPTPEQLRQLLRYEPDTGKLFWLPRPESMFKKPRRGKSWNTQNANKEAFKAFGKRYKVGCIFRRSYLAHRVAYAVYHGHWPKEQIDHINGDGFDNRITNLREASPTENMRNKRMHKTNTSGHNGVYFCDTNKNWRSFIYIGNKRKDLGRFTNIEDAIAARKAAEEGHGFTERHGT